jgi:hypothetical protein
MIWSYLLKGVIKNAPAIISAGATLYQSRANAHQESKPAEPKQDNTNQITNIIQRIEQLETRQAEQDNIQRQTAEQLQKITDTLNEISCCANTGVRLGVIALIIAISALMLVIFR